MRALSTLLALLCIGFMSPLYCQSYPQLSSEEMAAYNNQITTALQNADAQSFSALEQIRQSPSMSIGDIAKLNAQVTAAQVKHTLATNFLNSPSMNSPIVRDAFLQLMQQPLISEQDLIQFQSLVNSEKDKMAADAATTAPAQ